MTAWLKKLLGVQSSGVRPASDSPPEIEADLLEAEAGARDLVDYLLSDRLFWQLSVATPQGERQPKMTLGSLYEQIESLRTASDLGLQDRLRLDAVTGAWDSTSQRFPTQFTTKLKRELDSYVRNWTYYLEQRRTDPERWRDEYEVEVRNRRRVQVVLGLLGPDAPTDLMQELQELESKSDED